MPTISQLTHSQLGTVVPPYLNQPTTFIQIHTQQCVLLKSTKSMQSVQQILFIFSVLILQGIYWCSLLFQTP